MYTAPLGSAVRGKKMMENMVVERVAGSRVALGVFFFSSPA